MNPYIIASIAALVVIIVIAYMAVKRMQAKAKEREWKAHARKRSREQHHEWKEAQRQAGKLGDDDGK